ncbi:hypothetical protein SAMN02745945_00203 [Peptoclostridium litorale DSM 5388]|uniref:Uncharacterized protein n=1 Tax=Peptoclostridium litorale DSM 5388 TaxID=1121324 RepID=A0A069RK93_PEPLI|nr:hypothetical protein [Peptoclostridium litorale]KDR96550.1 hypothetical protein CLIT_2c01560 [Peptoclostridium litorale DSM 5388]SIN69253.1 hypothetical protein SAMN02745945_00203 [Peptoclostridium litorale DSM 5388]
MKKICLKAVAVLAVLIFTGTMVLTGSLNSESSKNASALEKSIKEKCSDYVSISLSELTPFEWEKVYFFPPYMPKAQMYEIMGFKSGRVSETFSEGMMNIVFSYGDKVVCAISGYNDTFGMSSTKIEHSRGENPTFIVSRMGREEGQGGRIYLQWYGGGDSVKTAKEGISPEMAGVWKCEDILEKGDYITEKYGEIVVSKDGIAAGYVASMEYRGGTDIHNLKSSQLAACKGLLSGKTAKFRLESGLDKAMHDGFELEFENGVFSGSIEITGELEELSGYYEFQKR